MKTRILFGCLIWLSTQALLVHGQAPVNVRVTTASSIQLKGIVGLGANQFALIEVSAGQPQQGRPVTASRTIMLAKGQREGEFEVTEVDASAGRVKLRDQGQTMDLAFAPDVPPGILVTHSSASETSPAAEQVTFLRLQGLSLTASLDLYQQLAQRSLLRVSSLPTTNGPDLYAMETLSSADVARSLEQSLAQMGVLIQPNGSKFAVAVAEGTDQEKIFSELKKAQELAEVLQKTRKASVQTRAPGASSEEDILAPGTINFPRTDLNQVLTIYAELTDRTLIRPSALPGPAISFRNYTPLTREECIYAFTAVFALNGISIIDAGEKLLLAVAWPQTEQATSLLSQKGALDYSTLTNSIRARAVNLPYYDLAGFAKVYGQLAGRAVKIGSDAPRIALSLVTQSEMTTGEALRALDLLFGLHGLKVVQPEGSDSLQIVQARKDTD